MIIADSKLVVALLLDHPQQMKASRLYQADPDWHLPDWWQIEVANALRNFHRVGSLATADALTAIDRTRALVPNANTHPVDLRQTLLIACDANISAYDARFTALARSFGRKLVTEDVRLRKACPGDTLSLEDALALVP